MYLLLIRKPLSSSISPPTVRNPYLKSNPMKLKQACLTSIWHQLHGFSSVILLNQGWSSPKYTKTDHILCQQFVTPVKATRSIYFPDYILNVFHQVQKLNKFGIYVSCRLAASHRFLFTSHISSTRVLGIVTLNFGTVIGILELSFINQTGPPWTRWERGHRRWNILLSVIREGWERAHGTSMYFEK